MIVGLIRELEVIKSKRNGLKILVKRYNITENLLDDFDWMINTIEKQQEI